MQNKFIIRDRCVLLLLLFIFSFGTYSLFGNNQSVNLFELAAFQHRVKGLVTDSNGVPIPGVNVEIKGTSQGTFTDNDGIFYLDAAPSDVLVLSYIGFKTLEVTVGTSSELPLTLQEDVTNLDAVTVNAGYYTVKERERTGSIVKVTAEEIELQPIVSPLEALQGRMAGVEVISGGSHPGMAPTIRIRGQNSLRSEGNLPLYVVNGVPINSSPIESNSILAGGGIDPLSHLNLSNIESIEILKDADATSIYGSRGANGVVLITTKKGSKHKTTIEARIYSGLSVVPNKLELLNTSQYLKLRNQAFENDDVTPDQFNGYDLVLWDQNRYTDWQDYFLGGTSPITNFNLFASGGNENTTFTVGGGFLNQGSVYPGDFEYNKITGSLRLDHTSPNKKLNINLALNYGLDINDLVGNVTLSTNIFSLAPNTPAIFTDKGELNWKEWNEAGIDNPFAGYFNESETRLKSLISNLGISYKVIPGLMVKANLGYTTSDGKELIKMPKRSYNPLNWDTSNHRSIHLNSDRTTWIIEPQLTYSTKIGSGTLDALIGGTFQKSTSNNLGVQGLGYVAETLIGNLNAANEIVNGNSQNIEYAYNAIFGRIGYNYDGKYYLNLTGRRDGSSRFGPGKQFSNFGAVGVAWIFSEEEFVKYNLGFLSFGKIRGSYGTTGSDQIGNYGYLDAFEATPGPNGLYPTQLSNPDFSWEVNKKLEIALDLGFIDDRLVLGISRYQNRSSNQLVGYPLPGLTGFNSVQANLAATVENKGWELEVSSLNIRSKNFRWQTSLNISIPKNKLLEYPEIEESSHANTYRVGYPLNIQLLYNYSGLDPETGLYTIEDVNGDGRYDAEDRDFIWDNGREFYGGISNEITFKNFSVRFLWQFVKQEGEIGSLLNPGTYGNSRVDVLQVLGDNSRYQNLSQSILASRAYSDVLRSNLFIEDASFLRLKTFSLAYSLPSRVTKTIGLNSCKLFLNGQNLITITDYSGLDPEMPGLGILYGGLRTITLGAQFNF